jgi:hypothetical protein
MTTATAATIPTFRGFLNADNLKDAKADLAFNAQMYFKDMRRPHADSPNALVYKLDGTGLVCFDADDQAANEHMMTVMHKHGVEFNYSPSVSNHFKHEEGENAHKFHYWFRTDKAIPKKLGLNGSKLDVLSKELVFEPVLDAQMYPCNAPFLTDAIYADILKIGRCASWPSGQVIVSALSVAAAPSATETQSPKRNSTSAITADDMAFLDANTTMQDAVNYGTWIKTLIKIANKFGKTERGLRLAHYFSAKAQSVYDPHGVDKEWESIQPEKYTECVFSPLLTGKCHIVLSDSELSDASTVAQTMAPAGMNYKLKLNIRKLSSDDEYTTLQIMEVMRPELFKHLKFDAEKWFVYNPQEKTWRGCKDFPTFMMSKFWERICYYNDGLIALKLSSLEPESDEWKTMKTAKHKILKTHLSAFSHSATISVAKQMAKELLLDVGFINKLNNQLGRLVFSDGIYNMETGEFRYGLYYDDFITETLPYSFDQFRAVSPDAIQRAQDIMMQINTYNEMYFKYHMELLGYALTGFASREEVFFMMIGMTASNGKSTVFEALTEKMSLYCEKLNSKTFELDNKDMHKMIGAVRGKRIAWLNEVSKRAQNTESIKEFADGTFIKNKVLYGTEEKIPITAKLFFISNGEPKFASDQGMFRRYNYVRFQAKFYEPTEWEKLEAPRPNMDFKKDLSCKAFFLSDEGFLALLRIILDGTKRWFQNGLVVPKEFDDLKVQACAKNDKYHEFITNHVARVDGKCIHKSQFEQAWQEAQMGGEHGKFDWSDFQTNMQSKGFIYDAKKNKKINGKVKNGCFVDVEFRDIEFPNKHEE